MIAALLLLQAQAATSPTPASPSAVPEVLVIGRPLAELKGALADCIARHCSPDEEIAAALALGERQFIDGDYDAAQQTLRTSLHRNRRFAKTYPVPVAGLLRASARVASHRGSITYYRADTAGVVDVLRKGLPRDDRRVLASEIEVGDMMLITNQLGSALKQYQSVADHAARIGQPLVFGMATLRMVSLYSGMAAQLPDYRDVNTKHAEELARVLASVSNPELRPFATAARILVTGIAARNGDASAVDRMIAEVGEENRSVEPSLLYQPPIKGFSAVYDGTPIAIWKSIQRTIGQWVDISFWIRPDGRVSDVAVLRSGSGQVIGSRTVGGGTDLLWTKPIAAQITGRRYAPLAMAPEEPGSLRVERYTLTRWTMGQKGSRIAVTDPTPELEMIDLTDTTRLKTATSPLSSP